MFTLLLGIDARISGWITAHLIAIIAVLFFVRTDLFSLFTQKFTQKATNKFISSHSRKITILFIIVVLGGALTLVMSLEPVQAGMLTSLLDFSSDKIQWNNFYFILDDLLIAFGVLILLAFIPIINRIFAQLHQTIDEWRYTRFRVIRIQSLELLTPNQLANLLILTTKYTRFAIILLLSSAGLTLVFSLYPQTEGLAQALWAVVVGVLDNIWQKILALLPNLVTLTTIIVLTRLSLKLIRFFYDGLRRGKIIYEAIHPELVEPTFQLLRFLVIAFAIVAAFPFIPGSSSPVFKGISIFIGFLLSLGSTSLVTNIVSGIVLTYTRGLRIGDRVQIAEATGDVIERTLLVTRVRTIKNEIISIPNAKVMQNQIINYSTLAADQGLILHTSITIGYDVPWRHVHNLLLDAARQTKDVIDSPAPFVLQTGLEDYYISYELNAYTLQASRMANTYSDLHQNIQDNFNNAGVEIMSPSYFAFRDGQESTVAEIKPSKNGKIKVG